MPAAIVLRRYGGPEVLALEERALPPLPADEVRLRTLAAAVNRADCEIRAGNWPVQLDWPFPYVPGLEVLGEVAAVGAGVAGWAVGARALTMMQRLGGIHGVRPGGYQAFVDVPAAHLAPVPAALDPLAVAALGLAAVTALNGLRRLALEPGQTLLVTGASGGVGTTALRLAGVMGLTAVATTSRAEGVAALQALGAARVIDLSRQGLVEALGARSLDAVLDTLGGRAFPAAVACLKRGGRLCLVGALTGPELRLSAWDLIQELRLTGWSSENLTGEALRQDMGELCGWLAEGRLAPPPYETLPLAEAGEAHRRLEKGGQVGRLLLVP